MINVTAVLIGCICDAGDSTLSRLRIAHRQFVVDAFMRRVLAPTELPPGGHDFRSENAAVKIVNRQSPIENRLDPDPSTLNPGP